MDCYIISPVFFSFSDLLFLLQNYRLCLLFVCDPCGNVPPERCDNFVSVFLNTPDQSPAMTNGSRCTQKQCVCEREKQKEEK